MHFFGLQNYNTVEYIKFIKETGLTNDTLRKSLKEKHNLQGLLKPQPRLKTAKAILKSPAENFLHRKKCI